MNLSLNRLVRAEDMAQLKQKLSVVLQEYGFGILSEINMTNTLKEKLDVEIEEYVIFQVCNPNFAYKILEIDRNMGIYLPCSIVASKLEEKVYQVRFPYLPKLIAGVENEEIHELARNIQQQFNQLIEKI